MINSDMTMARIMEFADSKEFGITEKEFLRGMINTYTDQRMMEAQDALSDSHSEADLDMRDRLGRKP